MPGPVPAEGLIVPGLATAVLFLGPLIAAQEQPVRDWYYCQLAERPYGRTVYVSEVFSLPDGASEVEVETAFEAHVQRRYVGEPVAGGLCLGPKESREEARDRRHDTIQGLSRDGVTVVRTDWRFRGPRHR
jgi:hypothetical protein